MSKGKGLLKIVILGGTVYLVSTYGPVIAKMVRESLEREPFDDMLKDIKGVLKKGKTNVEKNLSEIKSDLEEVLAKYGDEYAKEDLEKDDDWLPLFDDDDDENDEILKELQDDDSDNDGIPDSFWDKLEETSSDDWDDLFNENYTDADECDCNECVSTECNVHKDNKCSCFDECVCGDVCDCDEPNACHTTKEEEYAEKLEKAKEYVEKNLNKGVEKLKEVYDRVEKSDAVKQGKDKLAELYDKVEHSDAVKQGKDKISEIYDKVEHSDVVMRSKDAAKGVYSKLEDSEFFKKANDTLSKLVEYSKKSELSLNVEEARKAFLNTLKDELDRRKKLEEEESGETEVPPIEVPNVSTDDNRTSPLKTTEEYINDLMKAAANNATPKSDVRADINRFAKESHDLKREITRRPEGSKKVIKIETKDNPSCE